MQPGFIQISGNALNDGTSVTFNLAFYSSSLMNQKTKYKIATISENCRPFETQIIPFHTMGRCWSMEIQPNGDVYATLCLDSGNDTILDIQANESISFEPGSYKF